MAISRSFLMFVICVLSAFACSAAEPPQGAEKTVRLLLHDINKRDKRAASWLVDPVEMSDESCEKKASESKPPQEVIDLMSTAHWGLKEFKRKETEDEEEQAETLLEVTLAGIPLEVKARMEFVIKNDVPLVAKFRLMKWEVDSSKLKEGEKKIDFSSLLTKAFEEAQKTGKQK